MGDWLSGIAPGELLRRLRGRRSNASREDLEDAVQDVMLRALETARRHDPPAAPVNPDAYFMRSVHNRLNSMQRARWREIATDAHQLGGDCTPGDNAATPDALHEARERAALFGMLAAALAERPDVDKRDDAEHARVAVVFARLQRRLATELTDKHWILIRLRVLEGVGFADCARLLGVSLGTAHNWTTRALGIVREALIECGVDGGALAYDEGEALQRGAGRTE